METMKTIAIRKSTRKYTNEPVSQEALDTILKAGCAAPVGRGAYDSLHITVINTPESMEKLNAAAQAAGRPGKPAFGAPSLVIISTKASGIPGLDTANAACVAENMIIAATDLGVGSVYVMNPIGLITGTEGLAADLGIPADFVPAAAVVLGMPEEPLTEERELTLKIGVNFV